MADRIEGMDELLAQLESLTLKEGGQVLAKAVKRGAQILAEEEEHRAPHRTGRLANNIRVMITDRSATEVIAKIGPSQKAFYASFEEWGTKNQKADPFVRPAYEAKITEALAVIEYDLKLSIEKALK